MLWCDFIINSQALKLTNIPCEVSVTSRKHTVVAVQISTTGGNLEMRKREISRDLKCFCLILS